MSKATIVKAKNGWVVTLAEGRDPGRAIEIEQAPYVFNDWDDLSNFLGTQLEVEG